ncbi:hypothetical protein OUZ56_003180 [Daphnia magna]|uniref:Secreted protein n=1 Tax=Daphnia magna TaxID=35525 RepID=A0ABR0A7Z7_9CRUS|nr:hypothetical protein OUZ56_003180 [Daphnia magna]
MKGYRPICLLKKLARMTLLTRAFHSCKAKYTESSGSVQAPLPQARRCRHWCNMVPPYLPALPLPNGRGRKPAGIEVIWVKFEK